MSYVLFDRLKNAWNRHTLGLRLVVGYALLFVTSVMLLAILAYGLFNRFMREPDRAFMQLRANELTSAYEEGGVEAVRRRLSGPQGDDGQDELIIRLADSQGRAMLLLNPDNWTEAEITQLAAQIPTTEEAWIALGEAEDEDALEAFVVRLSDNHILQIGMDADLRQDAMESIQGVFFAIAIPVLALALIVGILMAYRALRPLRQLVATFYTVIDTGDIKTRVPVEGARGEFADLIHLFNRMLGRVDGLVETMRGTLDSVAHDLRTPLTRIRGTAEVALHVERDPDSYRDALAMNLETSDTMEAILDSIMDDAEAETGAMPLHKETLLVSDLVDDIVKLYEVVAEDKRVRLSTEIPSGITIFADRTRMRQVLANLVDNAVKYSPVDGAVHLTASRGDLQVSITVTDTGPGIAPSEQPRIWDRLYRGEQGRAKRGLGLGLSLVRAVVHAHGGKVVVDSALGCGSAFTIALPRD